LAGQLSNIEPRWQRRCRREPRVVREATWWCVAVQGASVALALDTGRGPKLKTPHPRSAQVGRW